MDLDVFDYLRESHHQTYEKAIKAVRFLEALGLEVDLRHPLKEIDEEWDSVKDEEVPIPSPPQRVDKHPPPVIPIKIPTYTNHKGKHLKKRGWVIEVVAQHLLNHWATEHHSISVKKALIHLSSSYETYFRDSVSKKMKLLNQWGLLIVTKPAISRKPAVYKVNPDYNPDHPNLAFLKPNYPNGFKDFDLSTPASSDLDKNAK